MAPWKTLSNLEDWKLALEKSTQKPVLIFKHSTRCSISQMALDRMNRKWDEAYGQQLDVYYLDLIAHRDVSNQIAADTAVIHESPQALLLKNGQCLYYESHQAIQWDPIIDRLKSEK